MQVSIFNRRYSSSRCPSIVCRDLIVASANKYKLPAIYWNGFHGIGEGLIYFGPDSIDLHRRSATYVDRILNGENAQ